MTFDYRLVDAGGLRLPAIARGPADGPAILLVPPLFEEMNRCRRLLADLGRALAGHGIASLLPDLPGTGDDSTGPASVAAWRAAVAALLAANPGYVFAIRGGALLTDGNNSLGLYRFSPVSSGSILLRDMMRAQAIADQERTGGKPGPGQYEARFAAGETLRLAGYDLTQAHAAELAALKLPDPAARCRTADIKPSGDVAFEAPPVWRQADPASTFDLAAALATDIAAWIR